MRVALTEGVVLFENSLLPHERVVVGNEVIPIEGLFVVRRAVLRDLVATLRILVDVDAQDASRQMLFDVLAVVRIAEVAEADVQKTVLAEGHAATAMQGSGQALLDQNLF